MKLNPFRKKTSGYYDAIKATFDDAHRELDATKNELAKAKAEYKFNIEIPHELLESARSELAAEVPSA